MRIATLPWLSVTKGRCVGNSANQVLCVSTVLAPRQNDASYPPPPTHTQTNYDRAGGGASVANGSGSKDASPMDPTADDLDSEGGGAGVGSKTAPQEDPSADEFDSEGGGAGASSGSSPNTAPQEDPRVDDYSSEGGGASATSGNSSNNSPLTDPSAYDLDREGGASAPRLIWPRPAPSSITSTPPSWVCAGASVSVSALARARFVCSEGRSPVVGSRLRGGLGGNSAFTAGMFAKVLAPIPLHDEQSLVAVVVGGINDVGSSSLGVVGGRHSLQSCAGEGGGHVWPRALGSGRAVNVACDRAPLGGSALSPAPVAPPAWGDELCPVACGTWDSASLLGGLHTISGWGVMEKLCARADVVCVQEARGIPEDAQYLPSPHQHYVNMLALLVLRRGGGGVVNRASLRRFAEVLRSVLIVGRAGAVRFVKPSGFAFIVIGVHLDLAIKTAENRGGLRSTSRSRRSHACWATGILWERRSSGCT